MDVNRGLVVGAGCLIVGLVLGYSLGGSDVDQAQLAQTRALSAKVETLSGEFEGLGQRIDGVESAVASLQGTQSQELQGLGAQLDGVGESLAGSLQQLGDGVSAALKAQLDELRDRLAGNAPEASPTTLTLAPGETAPLGDRLEVFLAATDPAAGTAMVAINGQALVQLTLGTAYETGGCKVALTGFDAEGGAFIAGGC